ncbi:hypothetical protein STENM223S_02424 [Streptomyces tendae]
MPTALATPWPSGQVVVSTPVVWPYSGWPGVLRAPRAEGLRGRQLQAEAGQVELGVEGQGRVAGGQHEAVASDPVRVGGVVPHHLLEEGVGGGGQAHRRTGMAVSDLLYGVGGQDAGGVDGPLVQFGPLEVCGGRLGAHPGSGLLSTCRLPVHGCATGCRAFGSAGRGEPTPVSTCVFSFGTRLPGPPGIRLSDWAEPHSASEYGGAHLTANPTARPTARRAAIGSPNDAAVGARPPTRAHPREGRGMGNV